MPDLVLFAACQKVIISAEDHTLSLITLLENINIPLPQDNEVPANLLIPISWDVIAIWRRTPQDANQIYEQRTSLVSPNGDETLSATLVFTMVDNNQRNRGSMGGFPAGQAGIHKIGLWLRRQVEPEEEWQQMASYLVTIVHKEQQSELEDMNEGPDG